ncbi:MAG: hypothetical protein WAM44_06795, partial [Chthoniobacterales bacterium]
PKRLIIDRTKLCYPRKCGQSRDFDGKIKEFKKFNEYEEFKARGIQNSTADLSRRSVAKVDERRFTQIEEPRINTHASELRNE